MNEARARSERSIFSVYGERFARFYRVIVPGQDMEDV